MRHPEDQNINYPVVLEACDEGGYTASCPAAPGSISEGDTYEETLENIKDAIHLYLRAVAREMDVLRQQPGVQVAEVSI